ncbi:MAG TPA: universal stress protein [Vicinamibacterales bacterium]|nr:universal stress protein [Vicinamibacterales bacterium]
MVQISRILCPIDFSRTSRHALQHAAAVATWYGAELALLTVLPSWLEPPMCLDDAADTNLRFVLNRQSAEEQLRTWLEPARHAGVRTDVVVDAGRPAARIVEQAKSRRADLLVMGTHGLSGVERFLLGSVTEKVVRQVECPVMTVPPSSSPTAAIPYTRVLCPVDFSESSLAALQFAFSIAKESDAAVTVAHVCEWPPDDERAVGWFDQPNYRELAEEDARGRLEALVPEDVQTWAKPSTVVTHGKPYREILRLAERDAVDLIVIGVRGRNPFDLAIFGSTTNQVVRHARCPVVTLRHQASPA